MAAERDDKGRFIKGHPSNGGRPKGLAEYVRQQTKEGKELVEFYLTVFRDDKDMRLRMQAADWLADRGFGRQVQAMEHSGPDGGPLQVVEQIVASRATDHS